MTTHDSVLREQAGRRLPDWLLPLLCCCAASVLILIPFFMLGAASGHDFEFHVASWMDVAYQWKEGILYPRWAGWMNHGFGEPRYIFYPPLSWILGAALTLLLPGVAVPLLYIVLTQTLAGVSAHFLLRRLVSRRGALLGALFYTVNPNALLMIYLRSDFAEQLACALFPLLLLAALDVCDLLENHRAPARSIAALAIVYAAVWLCNAPAGVISSYVMALIIGWAALTRRSWPIVLRGGFALALGFGLTAFYIVPAAYEQRWVNIGQALSSGLVPWQNFLFTAIDDVEHTWFNWIASFCAVCTILVFGLAALLSRKFSTSGPAKQNRSAYTVLLVTGTAATFLMLRSTLPLWNHLPKLRFVQFPWRLMSIVAVVAACFLAAVADKRRGWTGTVLVLTLTVPLAWFLVRNTWWDEDEMPTMRDQIESGTGFDGTDEYDPRGDDHMDLKTDAPMIAILAGDSGELPATDSRVQVRKWTTQDKEIRVQSPTPARVALRLLNYPAWKVTVNGTVVQPERMDDVNQMVVPVNSGDSEIRVRFARTIDRTAGDTISLISGLLALAALWSSRNPQRLRQ